MASILILRLSDASDVDGSVDSEPAAITELEGSWPELAADLDDLDVLSSSWARRVWKAWTALHWEESSGRAVLLASVSFVVGAIWRVGRDGGPGGVMLDLLDYYQPNTIVKRKRKRTDDVGVP